MNRPSPVDNVKLFIGTAGDHGQSYPGAEMPFGLVKLAPDTYPGAVTGSAHAGYDYDDRRVMGFSHLRFSGVGNHGVGGNILLLPIWNLGSHNSASYSMPFDKASEQANPGYYRAVVGEPGIEVELTATDHVGLHRYTFTNSSAPHVLIDLGRSFTKTRYAFCAATGRRELVGEITSEQMRPFGYYRIFFSIQFQRSVEGLRFDPGGRGDGVGYLSDDGTLVAVVRFDGASGAPLMVKVGLSSISVDQARRNIECEAPDWDFDVVHECCRQAWAETLGRIEVAGQREYQELFYTHLYRSCLSPFNVTSSAGTYMGNNAEVHEAHGLTRYNGWSNWDTYRTKFPLLTLVEPDRMPGMMHSLTETLAGMMDKDLGVPRGEVRGFHPVPTVRVDMSVVILLDAFRKGIQYPDPQATYNVMREIADREFHPDLDRLGFIPRRPDRTCEVAYDSWAVAEMARVLGRADDVRLFGTRAAYYANVWDRDLGFFRARDEEGNWLEFPEDPAAVVEKYVYEGSAWHWRWAVVHAVKDVVRLMGGQQRFIEQLTYFFEHDLHNHGNQPGIHAPWLFAAGGAPWLSQKWVRQVLTEPMLQRYGTHGFLPEPFYGPVFRAEPEGFIPEMDDDDGTMAAWYVWSSLGLFPLCPGRPIYAVGTPLFEQIILHHPSGRDFRIVTKGQGKENWYIQSARLNGASFNRPWIGHQELVEGGVLELKLGPQPNTAWGTGDDLPW